MTPEAAAAAGYVVVLIAASLALDLMARHTHRRSGRYRTAGFEYLHALDAWRCPEGEFLRRIELDHSARLVRYRARAAVCNACPAKADCTDSDQGREVTRAVDPWPHSEAGRFHRGISVVLLALAALISVVFLVRDHGGADLALLASALAISTALLFRLGSVFLHTPADFPAAAAAPVEPALPQSAPSRGRRRVRHGA
jgi:hypothetical protein